MGPMVSKTDRDRMFDIVKDAVRKGAILEYGGKIPEGFPEKGNWIEPTVISGITPEMTLFRKETFGQIWRTLSRCDGRKCARSYQNT